MAESTMRHIQIRKDTKLRYVFGLWFQVLHSLHSVFLTLRIISAKSNCCKTCLKDGGVVLTCLGNLRRWCSGLCSWFMLTFASYLYTLVSPNGLKKTDTRKQKPKGFANLHWPLFFSTKIDIFVLKGAWKSTWIIPIRAEAAYICLRSIPSPTGERSFWKHRCKDLQSGRLLGNAFQCNQRTNSRWSASFCMGRWMGILCSHRSPLTLEFQLGGLCGQRFRGVCCVCYSDIE